MKALPEGEIMPYAIAYMENRVRKSQGRLQLYGTQYTYEGDKVINYPIQDSKNLAKRRAEMGLKPYEEEVAEVMKKTPQV